MITLLNKTNRSLKEEGFKRTLLKMIRYPINTIRSTIQSTIKSRSLQKHVFSHEKIEDRFTAIYGKQFWGGEESISGSGSTLEFTENLRNKLPELLKTFSVKTIFDAPCGDLNWMRHVLKENDLEYIGGDIVLPLVESLNERYGNTKTRFMHVDLTSGKLPMADLMICRDCLFHLSLRDTKLALRNYVDSNIPYLLTTTHTGSNKFKNRDITTGDFRFIDLFSAPYYFPKEVLFRIDDWKAPFRRREMCLWSRAQIVHALTKFGSN